MSKFDTLKYIFDNLINKTLIYDFNIHIDLIIFNIISKFSQNMIYAFEKFSNFYKQNVIE